ncbi:MULTISPECIES: hypothetical protein [Sphingomonadaceae]|uniref:hypothetical protein n=1 Tax=Sphingomonadales TaxID=204457 RepID=UPI000A4C52AE|nr:hypothetical protein [Sphingobium sp. TKS]MCF8707567.1 hypothetical protein [Rhizorhapis sp. SPR117]
MDDRVAAALGLMERALHLLDDAQNYDAAAELQRLIDALRGSGDVDAGVNEL